MIKYGKIQHPMDSFGIKEVSHGQIRFERLETRLEPKIPFPHKHSFYQLLLITQGNGSHIIDFETYKVAPKSLFIMKPGQLHSWRLSGAKGIILEFNRESLTSFKDAPLIDLIDSTNDFISIRAKHFQTLTQLFEIGVGLNDIKDPYLEISLEATLVNILIEILRMKEFSKKDFQSNSIVHHFKVLLEEHFKSHHNLEFYAQALNLNSKNLSMKISRGLGKSARTLIHDRIFLEAKRYLAFSDLSIGLISQTLGFEDQNYFARFFKKMQGRSPSEFRQSLTKEL